MLHEACSTYIDPALDSVFAEHGRVFAEHGRTRGSWDVLAALRRAGEPYRLTPTDLYQALMRTSGAIAHTHSRRIFADQSALGQSTTRRTPPHPSTGSERGLTLPSGAEFRVRVGEQHEDQ